MFKYVLLSQVFLYATKRFESNTATACILLAEYSRMVQELEKLEEKCEDMELKKMLEIMRVKLEGYQAEAAASDVIVLSTILNPRFRLRFFRSQLS